MLIPDNTLNIIMEKMKMIKSNENSVLGIDIDRLYELISRIPKIKNELMVFIENYIYEKGMESISKHVRSKTFIILSYVLYDLLY
jgi:hypothetical protein